MKQCVQARLQTVPPTWNQRVSSERSSTLGGAAWAGGEVSGAIMALGESVPPATTAPRTGLFHPLAKDTVLPSLPDELASDWHCRAGMEPAGSRHTLALSCFR